MKNYKSEDNTRSEGSYRQSDKYSSNKTENQEEKNFTKADNLKDKDYTKEKGRRISFQEFLDKYKLNGNVEKDRE
jgi:hypothetical protein